MPVSSSTAISLDHLPPTLPTPDFRNKSQPALRRRHWVINRNAPSRQRGKEKEDDQQDVADVPTWQTPREPHALDFGSFSVLAGALAEEMERRGLTATAVNGHVEVKESLDQEVSLELTKNALDLEAKLKAEIGEDGHSAGKSGVPHELNVTNLLTKGYWTDMRAAEAEEYLKDVVYGGPEGFAYLRSLGEFVSGKHFYTEASTKSLLIGYHLHLYSTLQELSRPFTSTSEECGTLGVSLPRWIVDNIIDPLTDGRHSLLRETASELFRQKGHKPPSHSDPRKGTVATQVAASVHMYPTTLIALSSLLHIRLNKIDMGSLLKNPDELFLSEEEWAGKGFKERRNQRASKVKCESGTPRTADEPDAMEVEEPEQTWASVDAGLSRTVEGAASRLNEYEVEGPEELGEVLEYVANVISELDRRMRAQKDLVAGRNGSTHDETASEEGETAFLTKSERDPQSIPTEEPTIRNLRLNLLALTKRAPLDTIARLPEDLVPPHIRHYVPTLGSSG